MGAQLGSDSRTANSIAIGVLGALFLLRRFAYPVDAPQWTVWANLDDRRPTGERGSLVALWYALAFIILGLGIAFALQARHDFGVGAIAPRPGPDRGKDRSTWRLALRLNWVRSSPGDRLPRPWRVFGYFTTSINDILGSDTAVKQILAARARTPDALVSAFLVTVLSLVGIIASITGVQTLGLDTGN